MKTESPFLTGVVFLVIIATSGALPKVFPEIKDWGSYIAAVCTILYVYLTYRLLKSQNFMIQKQEESQKDSMRPFLTLKSLQKPLLRGENGIVTWGLYLVNIGCGPAVVTKFLISDGDKKEQNNYYDLLDIKTIGPNSGDLNMQIMVRNTTSQVDTKTISATIEYSDLFNRMFRTQIIHGKTVFEGPLP